MFLFKKPEYKRFDLKPRYWDPVKEEQEARRRRIRAELKMEEDNDQHVLDIRGQFRKEFEQRRGARRNTGMSYSVRLFMILTMLFIVAFLCTAKNPEGLMRFFGL